MEETQIIVEKKKRFDSEKYNEAKSQFKVEKLTPLLRKQAMRYGYGHAMDAKLVKLELTRIKLESKKNITEKQKLQLEKIMAQLSIAK